jgi:hypothetical protein
MCYIVSPFVSPFPIVFSLAVFHYRVFVKQTARRKWDPFRTCWSSSIGAHSCASRVVVIPDRCGSPDPARRATSCCL